MGKSYLTARARNDVTWPTKMLVSLGLLTGKMIDYGCGKSIDADVLGMDKYDKYYHNVKISRKYDTIICNYVLNVLEEDEANQVINKIKNLLKKKGKAYLSVRRDNFKEGITSKGTYQRKVYLDLPIIYEDKLCCIYELTK